MPLTYAAEGCTQLVKWLPEFTATAFLVDPEIRDNSR